MSGGDYVMQRILRGAWLLPVLTWTLSASAAASPEEMAEKLAAPGAWAYVNRDGEVIPSGSFTGIPPGDILTEAGLEARNGFDFRTDDPVLGCGPPGMPRALTAASPMSFAWNRPYSSQWNDLLIIRYESMDVTRLVFMDQEEVPPRTTRTPNGYARGYWDDDTLVIQTSHMDTRVQDLQGTPKSEQLTLEERYHIEEVEGETYLRVDLTMTDPVYLKEPYVWHFDFVHKPDWEVARYGCVERPDELMPGAVAEDP